MAASIPLMLAQQRYQLRQQNNRYQKFIKDGPKIRSITYLTIRLEMVNELYSAIRSLHMQLVGSNDKEAIAYCTEDLFSDAQEIYVLYKNAIKKLMDTLRRPIPPERTLPQGVNVGASVNALPHPQGQLPGAAVNMDAHANQHVIHQELHPHPIASPVLNVDYQSRPSYKNSLQHPIANQSLPNPAAPSSFQINCNNPHHTLLHFIEPSSNTSISSSVNKFSRPAVVSSGSFQANKLTAHSLPFTSIPQINGSVPQTSYADSKWTHVKNLQLADPPYNRPDPIDLLLQTEIVFIKRFVKINFVNKFSHTSQSLKILQIAGSCSAEVRHKV